ncbi:hypothetical protein HJC99_00365 [Candidatus Saccharibacteria bacterium]|nr:hypothetical protein [Candidatus Saccharibacteria bacterium]
MHFTANIGGNILAGVVAGAITAAIIIAAITALGGVANSMVSFGGSGGFVEKFFKGSLIYIPVGMIVGGAVAATGLPWWTSIIALVVVFFILNLVMKARLKARGY